MKETIDPVTPTKFRALESYDPTKFFFVSGDNDDAFLQVAESLVVPKYAKVLVTLVEKFKIFICLVFANPIWGSFVVVSAVHSHSRGSRSCVIFAADLCSGFFAAAATATISMSCLVRFYCLLVFSPRSK